MYLATRNLPQKMSLVSLGLAILFKSVVGFLGVHFLL